MISSEISNNNYELLSHIKQGQNIGSDRSGRLYVIESTSFLSSVVQKIFQDEKRLQHIVQGFVIEKLKEKQFHDVTGGRDAYLALLNQFVTEQLSSTQKSALAFDYYNGRYRDLVASGMESWRAECQIVLEMLDDPNIPSGFKADIASETSESGVYLKDRAGRKIAILDHPWKVLSKAHKLTE